MSTAHGGTDPYFMISSTALDLTVLTYFTEHAFCTLYTLAYSTQVKRNKTAEKWCDRGN
ncbi:hypothetical protein BDR04DRAFT_1103533 [Suillus decipiens]|nr:hypothetical protein BDR04DRAFT_1103533 [Suillus decipiens]